MRAQRHGFRILRIELLDELGPQHARGAHLGDLHEVVHADAPEEGDARREAVDIQAGANAGAQVFEAVGQRVGQFQVGGRAGFLHVIAADADAVELRHLLRGVAEDVADDPHGGFRRIDVGVADHELFQNVVLNGAAELLRSHALLFGGHDVERHDGQHGAVHGHRNGHLVERNLVEEDLHVLHGIDGHAGLADVADHALVVRIVAAMGGQIEGHREAFLAGRQIAPVEGVGFLGRGEARVLADGPGLARVHGGIRAAQIGRQAGGVVQVLHAFEIRARVPGLDRDVFRRQPFAPRRVRLRGELARRWLCSRSWRNPVAWLIFHPEALLPGAQDFGRIAADVHEIRDAGLFQLFDGIRRIAGHDHGRGFARLAQLLNHARSQRGVLRVGAAQYDDIGIACQRVGDSEFRIPRSRRNSRRTRSGPCASSHRPLRAAGIAACGLYGPHSVRCAGGSVRKRRRRGVRGPPVRSSAACARRDWDIGSSRQ